MADVKFEREFTRVGWNLLGGKIPSAPSEDEGFGVQDVGVDLSILEESVRLERVCIRIDRFVAEHSPSQ